MIGAPRLAERGPAWRGTKVLRLTSATDFERVRRDGRSHAHPLVVLVALRRPAPGPGQAPAAGTRIGVVAGKGVGNAVARNRAKRLLREAVRACAAEIEMGWDLVFIARRPLPDARLFETSLAVLGLLRRALALHGEQGRGG